MTGVGNVKPAIIAKPFDAYTHRQYDGLLYQVANPCPVISYIGPRLKMTGRDIEGNRTHLFPACTFAQMVYPKFESKNQDLVVRFSRGKHHKIMTGD